MKALRVLLATLCLAAGLVATGGSAPAAAATPESLVSIKLESLTPSLPERESEITLSGEVTNTSKKRLLRPRAYFWRNQAPITDREGFDQALDSAANDPIGARKIASFDNLFEDDDPYLEAGDSAEFTLRVNVADLELSPTSGIYLMGVHVLQNETTPAIGRARVFVPVLTELPRNSLQMTTVVALNSRPSLVSKGLFVDNHLAEEIAPGGRLDTLLKAADSDGVSYAVDPALVEEVQTMRGGYEVLEDGRHDGDGKADADRWMAAFTRMAADHDGYRLLYGSPDVAALAHAGQTDVLSASQTAARTVATTSSLPLLVWPASGVADVDTVVAAAELKPAALLLSDSSTRSSVPLLQGMAVPGLDRTPIANYTTAAFSGGPGPKPRNSAVHLQQRLLAEGWLQAATSPAGTTLGRVRVIDTAAQAWSDDESVKAPWIKQTTLSDLLRSAPAEWPGVLHHSEKNRADELGATQLGSLARLSGSWATWQDLLVDKSSARATASAAVARAANARLRGDSGAFRSLLALQQDELDTRLDAVRISATRQVLTPKSEVSFPITIRNTLAPSPEDETVNQVRVQLRFTSANSQRLSVQPIPTETIDAGENFQGEARVEARSNGTVRVTAQLYTPSGLPVGKPAIIDVKATQAGTVGWFIAIGAGIVLVGSTALRIRQVARARARTSADAPPAAVRDDEPLVATRSAPPQDLAPQGASTSQGQSATEQIDV